jgi:ABC-type multidrug transport system ATPase subunit
MPKQKSVAISSQPLIPMETIADKIFLIRGQKVMLDRDLAELYGVSTKRLNEQVKRNRERFPEDFMFHLTREEGNALLALRSQNATLKRGQHLKYAPYAFTEHGAFMAANVLNSPIAVRASIQVVRAFVKLRELLITHKALARQIEELEGKYSAHDAQIQRIFSFIKKLMRPTRSRRRQIGFVAAQKK